MKKILQILSTILLLIVFCACPDKERLDTITIENQSNDTIVNWFSFMYPDTTINLRYGFEDKISYDISTIAPKNESKVGNDLGSFLGTKKLIIFIFSKKVIDTTPWDSVRNNYLILKRYDLDLKTLDSLNWRITYR